MSSTDDPLRFDQFQERSLYGDRGFFTSGGQAGGRRGDFITSPEVGPLFGATLARGLDRWWSELGQPDPFEVVEVGAGRGALAAAVCSASPACGDALRYVAVERSALLRGAAVDLLGDRAVVAEVMPDAIAHGVVLANELLDNLPVRVVERAEDGWLELHVSAAGDEVWLPTDLAVPWDVSVGTRLPVQEAAAAWVRDARSRLGRGRVLCIDYGVRHTIELADRAFLRTYRGHERGHDPLADPGHRDITVDVAFDQLPAPDALRTQAALLADLGIEELVGDGRRTWAERAAIGDLAAIRGRSRIIEAEALTDPDGLGAFLAAEWIAS